MRNGITKKKRSTRRASRCFFAFFMVIALILSLCTCSGNNSGGSDGTGSITIQREPEPAALQTANAAVALALRQYIYARLKTEEFVTTDLKSLSKEELTKMTDELVNAWESADMLAAGAEQLADQALTVLDDTAIKQTVTSSQVEESAASIVSGLIEFPSAYASNGAKEFNAKTWAENLTRQYDAIKGGQTIKQLANQLGTDAKSAYQQLVLAQEVIHSEAMDDAAFWDNMTKIAQTTKTVCKVTLYVAATIHTGGGSLSALAGSSMTLGTAGATIVGGADCIVDVASTGSNIILGENHQVTVGFDDIKDKLAPVSAVVGLATLNSGELGEQISYVGDTLTDWFFENKILGVKMSGNDDGTTISAQPISISDATDAGVESALEAAEFIFPGTGVKTLPELMGDYELSPQVSAMKLKELVAKMTEILDKSSQLNSGTGADAGEEFDITGPEALAGTYIGTMTMTQIEVVYDSENMDENGNISHVYRNEGGNNEFGDWEGQPFDVTVELVQDGNYLRFNDEEGDVYMQLALESSSGMLKSKKTFTQGTVTAEGKLSSSDGRIHIRLDVKETYETSQVPDGVNLTVLELTKTE